MPRNTPKPEPDRLGKLEHLVLDFIWSQGRSSAEDVREGLSGQWPMKDSTVRTVLRRLEAKGYLRHTVEGRTYIYEGTEKPGSLAARAVRRIVDRFCQGSVETLLVGMVENRILKREQLERLARKIADSKRSDKP